MRIRIAIAVCIAAALVLWAGRAWLESLHYRNVLKARETVYQSPGLALDSALKLLYWKPASEEALELAVKSSLLLGKSAECLTFLERLIATGKDCTSISLQTSQRLSDNGYLTEAESILRKLLEQSDSEAARRQLATLLLMEGRREESLSFLEQTVRGESYLLDELVMLGSVSELLENTSMLKLATQQNPDSAIPWVGLGKLAAYSSEHGQAIPHLERALEIDPNHTEAWAALGLELVTVVELERLQTWEQALPQTARDHPDVLYSVGFLKQSQGELRTAVETLQECLQRNPNHRRASYLLGRCLVSGRLPELAEVFTSRAALLDELEILLHRVLLRELESAVLSRIIELQNDLGRPLEANAWCVAMATYFPAEAEAAGQIKAGIRDRFPGELPLVASETRAALKLPARKIELLKDSGGNQSAAESVSQTAHEIEFRELGAQVGLNLEYFGGFEGEARELWIYQGFGGGVAVTDFDKDQFPDLYFTQGSSWPPDNDPRSRHALFRLRGDRFVQVTDNSQTGIMGFGQGVSVGDFDADGFDDLYVAQIGRNRLLRNNGDGTFTDVTGLSIPTESEWTTSCLLADLNGDGFDDLVDVNYAAGSKPFEHQCQNNEIHRPRTCKPDLFEPATDRVCINTGDGRFVDVTKDCGILPGYGRGMGILAADFDENGTLDLFVSNDMTPNEYYDNRGNAPDGVLRLSEEGVLRGVAYNGSGRVEACMGIGAGDLDEDGQYDLFVTNFYDETNTLYCMSENGFFEDRTATTNAGAESLKMLSFGTQFLDADGDGDLEILLVNGHVDDYTHMNIPWKMRPALYQNLGQGRFELDQTDPLGAYSKEESLGRALATLDWNRDGRMDVVVTHLDRPPALLENRTTSVGNSVSFQLIGTRSSRRGAGAILKLNHAGRTQVLQQTGGDGYYCSNEHKLMAGLGQQTLVPSVEVRWPSGVRQEYHDLQAGRCYLVVEGSQSLYSIPNENR